MKVDADEIRRTLMAELAPLGIITSEQMTRMHAASFAKACDRVSDSLEGMGMPCDTDVVLDALRIYLTDLDGERLPLLNTFAHEAVQGYLRTRNDEDREQGRGDVGDRAPDTTADTGGPRIEYPVPQPPGSKDRDEEGVDGYGPFTGEEQSEDGPGQAPEDDEDDTVEDDSRTTDDVPLPMEDDTPEDEGDPSLEDILYTMVTHGFRNIWITGPSGSGKSYTARRLAERLGCDFELQSPVQSFSGIKGYAAPDGYVHAAFSRGFLKRCVLVVDEIDHFPREIMPAVNEALSNGYMDLLGLGTCERHPDCVVIATSNTTGMGAVGGYVSAEEMDESVIDRFVFVPHDYEPDIDLDMAEGDRLLAAFAAEWRAATIRAGADRCLFSYRTLRNISRMMTLPGMTHAECLDRCLVKGRIPSDLLSAIRAGIPGRSVWTDALDAIVEGLEAGDDAYL